MDPRHVLVLMTADNCSHCRSLHERWPKIEKALSGIPSIRIVKISLPSTGSELESKYSFLQGFKKWFPMIILIPSSEWSAATAGSIAYPRAVVMNGDVNSKGEVSYKAGSHSTTEESLPLWVKEALTGSIFSTKIPVAQPMIHTDFPSFSSSHVHGDVCSGPRLNRRK